MIIKNLGVSLGEIRNIILHPKMLGKGAHGKYKKYLTTSNVGNLAEIIFGLFMIALYKQFKLKKELVDKFQKTFSKGRLTCY